MKPGNSGGPAFADLGAGKVAGVAFSKNVSSTTDNIGYLIPEPVVRFFLEEYAHYGGSFRGVASPGFATQTTENSAAQAFLKVATGISTLIAERRDAPLSRAFLCGPLTAHVRPQMHNTGGAVIVQLDPMSEAIGALQVGDVVTAIEGVPVASDETGVFANPLRQLLATTEWA